MVPPMPSIGPLPRCRLLHYQNNVWSLVDWHKRVNTNLDLSCPAQPVCRNQLFRPFMKYTAFSQISQRHIACGIFLLYTFLHLLYTCQLHAFLVLRKGCPYSKLFWSAFSAFGLNTERYSVSVRLQSEFRKMRTRGTPNTDIIYVVWPLAFPM